MNEIEKLRYEIREKGEFTDEMLEKAVARYLSNFLGGEEPDGSVFNIGFDVGDLKGIKISLSKQNLRRLTFVKEAFSEEQIRDLGIEEIIEQGKFSNKMQDIHNIAEKNTAGIGIIDSYFKVDGLHEFEGRDVKKIIIYRDKEKGIIINPSIEFSEDDYHGKTTACLAAGNKCGVIPESQLYLFQLNGVKREEAYEHILKYMKEHNIKLDVLINPAFNQKAEIIQNSLNELDGDKKCEYFDTADFWKNCAWGRYSDDGEGLELDEIAQEIISTIKSGKISGNGMENKLEVMGNVDDKILIPCTGMTGIQEDFKDKDKYYGSVCGASFPTIVLGSIFASVRQINPNITKKHFFEVMRETALINSRGQKYLNQKGMLEMIKEETKNQNKYRLYEKVPKSDEYEFGLKLLEQSENPFKDGPCLVSMIAIAMWEKDINGALNQGMEALRLRTNHNENSGIGLEDFQGKILSVAYGEPSEKAGIKGKKMSNGISRKENLDDEFTKKYLFPLIEDDGKKIDVLQAMRNMRNVNLMTYCGATGSALRMEECLKNRMNELGYSEQEISQIQSQMCVIGYATDIKMRREFVDKKKVESTCISVGDVNDPDVSASQSIREKAKMSGPVYFGEGYYFHYGNGEHSLKGYILQDPSLSAVISSVLTKAVSNSIENTKSTEFKPITKELLTADIKKIIEGVREGKSREELMAVVENGITYDRKLPFSEQEIGKAKINNSTEKKDMEQQKMQRDEHEIQQIKEATLNEEIREHPITLNQIGQETKDDFASNPAEAIEAIEILDNGVKMQEKIKEGQTQGEE